MFNLLILLLGISIAVVVSYALSSDNFFSPSFIISILFWISVILAIRDVRAWNVETYIFGVYGTFLILSGIYVFIITEHITKRLIKKKSCCIVEIEGKNESIHISSVKLILYYVFLIILVAIYCISMYRVAKHNGYAGGFDFSKIAKFHHDLTFKDKAGYDTPRVVRIIKLFIEATNYVFLYIFIKNVIFRLHKIWYVNIKYLFPIFVSVPTNIINSSRTAYLQLAGSALFMIYVQISRKNQWKKNRTTFKKIMCMGTIFFCVTLSLFYLIQANGFFGRITNRSMIDHITMYVGAPIIHFYQFLDSPPLPVNNFGQETFSSLNNLFYKLHVIKEVYSSQLEFRSISGHTGNIYTFFRRPYHDFGIIGMYIITILTSVIFSLVYYGKVYGKFESVKNDRNMILYSYFLYIIYLFPMLCEICNLIYFGIIYFIVMFFFIYGFVVGNISIKRGILRLKFK